MRILLTLSLSILIYGQTKSSLAHTDLNRHIDTICHLIESNYVFPDIAERMSKQIRENYRSGKYDQASVTQLADLITIDMRSESNDKHNVIVVKIKAGSTVDATNVVSMEKYLYSKKLENHGINTVKILNGNIGYFKYDSFGELGASQTSLQSAFQLLCQVDALIIDLSDNRGGSPSTVRFIASFFFKKATLLNRQYWRQNNQYTELWSLDSLPEPHFDSIPLVILTSKHTASAAESFAYIMRHNKKATLIGQSTSGGANMADVFDINDRFLLQLAIGRPVNPITNSNWEGTGVIPNIIVNENQRLESAIRYLLQLFLAQDKPLDLQSIYKTELSTLENK